MWALRPADPDDAARVLGGLQRPVDRPPDRRGGQGSRHREAHPAGTAASGRVGLASELTARGRAPQRRCLPAAGRLTAWLRTTRPAPRPNRARSPSTCDGRPGRPLPARRTSVRPVPAGGSPPGGAGDHPGRGDRRRVLPADQRRGPRSDVAHQGAGVAPPPAAPVTLPAARLSGGSARGLRPSAGSPFRVTRCPQAWPTQPGSRRLSRVMQPRTRLMAPGGPTYTGTAPHTAHRQSSRVVFRLTVPGCADRGGDPGRNRSRPVFAAPVHGVLRRGPDVRVSLSPSAPGDT